MHFKVSYEKERPTLNLSNALLYFKFHHYSHSIVAGGFELMS